MNLVQPPTLRRAYQLMRQRFGHLKWWPGETPFEVCIGAILTQNTAWSNVEKAIANLKAAQVMEARRMLALPESELAALIRPAGYFNLKAKRLRAFLGVLVNDHGGRLESLMHGPTPTVRQRLLDIYGIGPETADSMLLYAGGHASFVVDAYTKRIFTRHQWWRAKARGKSGKGNTADEYAALQKLCETALDHLPTTEKLDYWQDYHAQLVMVGKHYCRNRQPDCEHCPLNCGDICAK